MATYYYAAYFNTPMKQSPIDINSHHPFGLSSHAIDQATTPAKTERQDNLLSPTERRILFANGASNPQASSPFFRLGAELRNQIYEELLCPKALSLKALPTLARAPSTTPALYPAILSTCRKIHQEAGDLLYSTTIFHAHPSLLSALPHYATPARPVLYPGVIAKINRWQLTLRLDTDPRFTMGQASAAFSGAEYLEISVWQSMFDGADASVLKLFTGVRRVKVARIRGIADVDLARWLEKRMMSDEVEDVCRCEDEREVRCGRCCKRVIGYLGDEWFGGRDAWTFGNR